MQITLFGLLCAFPEAYHAAVDDVKALKVSNLDYAPYDWEQQRAYEYARATYIEECLTGEYPPRPLAKKYKRRNRY